MWATPWREKWVAPALRKVLELLFEHLIVSHGESVQARAAYERWFESALMGWVAFAGGSTTL